MTDKKLTEIEITVTALKEILEVMLCEGDLQNSSTISKALDLINRLQADNERLQSINDSFTDIGKLYSEIKAEAYKEFAERLKAEYADFDEKYEVILPENIQKTIADLLRELVGDSNA